MPQGSDPPAPLGGPRRHVRQQVTGKTATDVECKVLDGGMMGSRRHLNVVGTSANLPAITDKDWEDLQFGVDNNVDFFALSFVRDEKVGWGWGDWARLDRRWMAAHGAGAVLFGAGLGSQRGAPVPATSAHLVYTYATMLCGRPPSERTYPDSWGSPRAYGHQQGSSLPTPSL